MCEILVIYLWSVAFWHRDGSDDSICSLPELRKCMNDAFCVTFGCFSMWSCLNELLHDLACLEEYLMILMENWTCFWGQVWFDDFTLFLLDWSWCDEFGCACFAWFISQDTQHLCRASYVTTSYIAHVSSLVVVKRVAVTFVEVSVCFGFLLLADANNADRTLCKYL